jgi:hypothetical protein
VERAQAKIHKPASAPSLAKLHKQFYSAKLKMKVDPDIFITYLEDKSVMSGKQFMLHIPNNLTKSGG